MPRTALETQYASLWSHCTMHISSVREQEQRLSKYYSSVLDTVHERTIAEMKSAKEEAEQTYTESCLQQATEDYAAVYDRLCSSILPSQDNYTQARNSSKISEERLKVHNKLLKAQKRKK